MGLGFFAWRCARASDLCRHSARRFEWLLLVVAWTMPLQSVAARVIPEMGHWTPAVLALLLSMIVYRCKQQTVPPPERGEFRVWGRAVHP